MAMGQMLQGPSVRHAFYLDPVSGQMKDLLEGGGQITQAGIPGLQNQADANVFRDVNSEVQSLYDPRSRTFARGPKNDQEAAAMNAFIEKQQSQDADRMRDEHRQRIQKIMGLVGLGGLNNSGGGFV